MKKWTLLLQLLCAFALILCDGADGFVLRFKSSSRALFKSPPASLLGQTPYTRRLSVNKEDYSEFASYGGESEIGDDSSASKKKRPGRRSRTTRLIRNKSTSAKVAAKTVEARRRHEQAMNDPTLLTEVKFSERNDLHSATKRAIVEVLGLQSMTEIQAKTYAAALAGESILGRSKTGTGKTLAYLLPALERLLSTGLDEYRPGRDVGVLIIAPTRELVIQIADQANAVLSFHSDMEVCDMYGGTSMRRDIRNLSGKSLPAVLVATPGRLLEHLETTRIKSRMFGDVMGGTRIVVLDEADQLFEGFSKEIGRIFSYLPRSEKRQTMLFSATMPRKVRSYVNNQLNIRNVTEVDCVDPREVSTSMTSRRVKQSYIILESMDSYVSTLVAIVMDAMKYESYKVLVFFPASKLVRFFARLFNEGLGISVLELHSRMSQASRSRASSEFRGASRSVMFTSDVSARGIDYPSVTMVVQYGAPSTNDNYVHRIGRTGRAGNAGNGLLVLLPFEASLVRRVEKLGLRPDTSVSKILKDEKGEDIARLLDPVRQKVKSQHKTLTPSAEGACRSFLAYYSANSNGETPSQVSVFADEFAKDTGLVGLPPIDHKLAMRLGLDGLVDTIE